MPRTGIEHELVQVAAEFSLDSESGSAGVVHHLSQLDDAW
jgi:hypothetical protein